VASIDFSLIGDYSGSGFSEAPVGSPDANGNLIGGPVNGAIDPLLGPLVYNGGPTPTHALLPYSPALDAGDPAAAAGVGDVPLYDQRGTPFARVAEGDGVVGARIDIGSFERQPNPLPGDYNFDGSADAADYVIWRKTLGSMDDLRADGSGDAMVDPGDHDVWAANFGNTMPPGAGADSTTLAIIVSNESHEPAVPTSSNTFGKMARVVQRAGPSEAMPRGVESRFRFASLKDAISSDLSVGMLYDVALLAWLSQAIEPSDFDDISAHATNASTLDLSKDAECCQLTSDLIDRALTVLLRRL
jgi:hypothetical protein